MVFVISGERREGKSFLAQQVVDELIHRHLRIGGILCPRRSKEIDEYELLCINTGEKGYFSSRNAHENWIHMGPFYFDQKVITMGKKCLDNCLTNPPELVVIDEIGPLEKRGLLWDEHLRTFLDKGFNLLLSIRSRMVETIKQHYRIENIREFKVDNSLSPADITKEIMRELKAGDA